MGYSETYLANQVYKDFRINRKYNMGNARIEFQKDHLIKVLLSYGETDLSEKVDQLEDVDIKAIGELAAKHIAQFNLVDQTIAIGAVEFFEGKSRELKRKKRDLKHYTANSKKSDSNISEPHDLLIKLKRLLKNK